MFGRQIIGTEMMPWLAGHKVNGQAVMSAAVFAEMALAAGCEVLGLPVEAVQVTELEIEQPLALDRQTRVTTQLAQSDDGIRVEIHARSAGGNWSRYAVAGVDAMPTDAGPAGVPMPGGSETEIVLPDEAADHPRLLHSSGAARCGAAASRCRRVGWIAGRIDRDPVPAGVIRDDPGVRAGRPAGPVPHRAGELRAGGCRPSRPDRPHGRHGDPDRGNHRRLPAADRPRHGAATAGAEDLRHRMGGEFDVCTGRGASAAPAGSWLLLADR